MQPSRPRSIFVKIADIVFRFSNPDGIGLDLEDIYRNFHCHEKPTVSINIHGEGLPPIALQEKDKTFDSGMVWSLFRHKEKHIIVLRSPRLRNQVYGMAVFDDDFRNGDIYRQKVAVTSHDLLTSPLEFPLAEVLMVCLLSQDRGLMVHACGISDHGQGYLFAGNSTHGKSTMARLWQGRALILNDDRIVLRRRAKKIWMYGTPWHGEYRGTKPQGAPLTKIFFLKHARTNYVKKRSGSAGLAMLLTRSFTPLWDGDGMHFTLDFCSQIIAQIPCYELGFVPGENIIDFIRMV